MDITPLVPEDRKIVDSYGPGRFKIGGEGYEGAVVVFPNRVVSWPVADLGALSAADFSLIADADPAVEVLLFGTGARTAFVKPSFKAEIKATAGVAVEPMETGAACRTYNILLAEGRRVAAALLPL